MSKLYQILNIGLFTEENLSKMNFWDDCKRLYPKATADFCDWIDNYKKKVNWDFLFKGELIKFHDIPFEMQIGIIMRYFQGNSLIRPSNINPNDKHDIISWICEQFELKELC